MPISEDEAYYLYWSNFLDWGYPEHPPFIALYLWFARNILGWEDLLVSNGQWITPFRLGSLRLVTFLFYAVVSVPLWFFGKKITESAIGGWILVAIFWLVPNFFGLTIFISPDTVMVPFLLFGLMCYYMAFFCDEDIVFKKEKHVNSENKDDLEIHFLRKKQNTFLNNGNKSREWKIGDGSFYWHRGKWHLFAGFFWGISFLSKVTALIPLMGVIIYVLLTKKRWFYLKNVAFLSSFFVMLLLVSPFLFWMYETDFIFLTQLFLQTSLPFDFTVFLIFYRNQIFLFGPMLLVLLPYVLFMAFYKYFKNSDRHFVNNNELAPSSSFILRLLNFFFSSTTLHFLLLCANVLLFLFLLGVVYIFNALYLVFYSFAVVLFFSIVIWGVLFFVARKKNFLSKYLYEFFAVFLNRSFYGKQNSKEAASYNSSDCDSKVLRKENVTSCKSIEGPPLNYFRDASYFFACISFFSLAFLVGKSFFNTLYPNWSVFLICSLLPLYVVFIKEKLQDKIFAAQIGVRQFFFLAAYILAFVLLVNARYELIEKFPNSLGRMVVFYKYQTFKEDAKEFYDTKMDKSLFIAGNNYQIPTFVNIFWQPTKQAATLRVDNYHSVVYDLHFSDKTLLGKDFYYIFYRDNKNKSIGNLWRMCEEVKKVTTFYSKVKPFITGIFKPLSVAEKKNNELSRQFVGKKAVGVFDLYLCKNYKRHSF